ncbi:hypothetical protein FIA58_011675 [Flavobacterium jejuense]|uniref:Lipoprotein n=1 Tax=Flavobacterium jejuense TaxID=1544455 RepID=A0ABX0IR76_9FLAO|nr:hypothetical protein [Flavobacterium jejuense]NHN26339.1 hypothetical protein [Flavobacterium jejuense]
MSIFKIDALFLIVKLFYFILVSIFFSSCSIFRTDARKDKLLKRDEPILIEKTEKLVQADQENRNLSKLYKKKNLNNMLNMDSISYLHWKDSIRALQQKIDYNNTIELIKLTKKYGYPDNSRISKSYSTWLVFQHCPVKLKKRVKKILIKENKKGRFKSEATLKLLMWHLNGRKMEFFNEIKKK